MIVYVALSFIKMFHMQTICRGWHYNIFRGNKIINSWERNKKNSHVTPSHRTTDMYFCRKSFLSLYQWCRQGLHVALNLASKTFIWKCTKIRTYFGSDIPPQCNAAQNIKYKKLTLGWGWVEYTGTCYVVQPWSLPSGPVYYHCFSGVCPKLFRMVYRATCGMLVSRLQIGSFAGLVHATRN